MNNCIPCSIYREYMYMNMSKKDDQSAQEIQADLSEVERDLTLRRLLWQSQEEWTKLVDEWTATTFDALPVETLQKNVNRYSQTVFMLEKGGCNFCLSGCSILLSMW